MELPSGAYLCHVSTDCETTLTLYSPEGEFVKALGPSRQHAFRHTTGANALSISECAFAHVKVTSYCHGERPDQTPLALPAGDGSESMEDIVRRMIQKEFTKYAEQQGHGTFEDEDDFDVPEEEEYISPYEFAELQDEYVTPEPEISDSVEPEKPTETPLEDPPSDDDTSS